MEPRVQAELRKIGIEVSDSTVWKYRPGGLPPSSRPNEIVEVEVLDAHLICLAPQQVILSDFQNQ